MRRGVCVKCGSRDIRVAASDMVHLGLAQPVFGGAGIMLAQQVYTYPTIFLCLYCGYMEAYILDPRALQHAAYNWPLVQPSPLPPEGGTPG